MARMTAAHLETIRTRHAWARGIRVFVETGTFRGERAAMAAAQFAVVHTVEISEKLHREAADRHRHPAIQFHLGDSRVWVPRLAAEVTEPAVWFLDAHWFSLNRDRTRAGQARDREAQIGGKEGGLPLWDELAALARRPYADVWVVDDVNDFGRTEPTPEWRDVSLDRIAAYASDRLVEAVVLGDQAVIYRSGPTVTTGGPAWLPMEAKAA